MTKSIFLVTAIGCCLAISGYGQQQRQLADIPGAIDGSKTPDSIPDEIARRLFFKAIAEPSSRTIDQERRQRTKLRSIQLTEDDLNVMASTMGEFHDHMEQCEAEYSHAVAASTTSSAAFDNDAWQLRRDSIVESAHATLQQQLSPLGLQRLEDYIRSRKVHMVIFPPPTMNHHTK